MSSKSAQERIATTLAMAAIGAHRPPKISTLPLAARHDRKESGRSFVILLQDDATLVSFIPISVPIAALVPFLFLPIPDFSAWYIFRICYRRAGCVRAHILLSA